MPVPVVKASSGTWFVAEPEQEVPGRVVAYCRVSSADQKPDLDRQVARVVQGATKLGFAVGEVVTEVGSGSVRAAAQTPPGFCRTLPLPFWSWSTVTGWPASVSSTWKQRWRLPDAAWWLSILRRPPATWCTT